MQLINTQQIEKPVKINHLLDPNLQHLDVNSIFYTIQGEGPFAGRTAVFVRMAGCNLQCPMCDTEYSERTRLTPKEIVHRVGVLFYNNTKSDPFGVGQCYNPEPLVVITGGEPLRQPINAMVAQLLERGFEVQIETNGTLYRELPYQSQKLTVVCSPKTGKVNSNLMPHIQAFKYVASAEELEGSTDGLPATALGHSNGGGLGRPAEWWRGTVYLQPADHKDEKVNAANMQAVVRSCLTYGYRLCLQMHKYAQVE